MKLENQVCTLEQSDKLRKLGVVANSTHEWLCCMPDKTGEKWEYIVSYKEFPPSGLNTEYMGDAYTVAELGVMLPAGKYDTCGWSDGWRIYTEDGHDAIGDVTFSSEADARASVLIYLLENKHITAEEVNNRLQSA